VQESWISELYLHLWLEYSRLDLILFFLEGIFSEVLRDLSLELHLEKGTSFSHTPQTRWPDVSKATQNSNTSFVYRSGRASLLKLWPLVEVFKWEDSVLSRAGKKFSLEIFP